MNSVFTNEDDREDCKTVVCFEGVKYNWGTDLKLERFHALKYIEKGMKGILSYTNSFLIFSL